MYPNINVVYGNGKYFWSGGTRKLWESASTKKDYNLMILIKLSEFHLFSLFHVSPGPVSR